MKKTEATAFSPASIGNIAVGFDILGHSIAGLGDTAKVRRIDRPDVVMGETHGVVTQLPTDAAKNTAGRALISLRERHKLPFGFEVSLTKGIPLGSGLGGSAASAVAALFAANALLEKPVSKEELYECALDGEAVASGSRHGDNVAPMIYGGVTLATEKRVVKIPTPAWLHVAGAHPHQVLETKTARAVLKAPYELKDFVQQSGHLAAFLLGLQMDDESLIREGLNDVLVEPRRASLIPGFAAVKSAALSSGALGSSISGAGPSVFAWFGSVDAAHRGAAAMQAAFAAEGISSEAYVSPVNGPCAELLS